jgi:hypothetical protein
MLRRQDIRLATVATLSGKTAAGDRVYPTWILPWRRELPLPAIGVYTLDETGEGVDGGIVGAFQIRFALKLVLEVVIATPVAPDLEPAARLMVDSQAALDDLCDEITNTLLRNPAWYTMRDVDGHLCARFQGVERWDTQSTLGRVDDTDQRTMAAQITATLTYGENYDPLITDDFCRAHLDVDVIDPAADPNIKYPGPDGRIEVELMIPRDTPPLARVQHFAMIYAPWNTAPGCVAPVALTSPTILQAAALNPWGTDRIGDFLELRPGDHVKITDGDVICQDWILTGAVIDYGDHFEMPVEGDLFDEPPGYPNLRDGQMEFYRGPVDAPLCDPPHPPPQRRTP